MRFSCSFTGRRVGAIGIMQQFSGVVVDAEDVEKARLAVYKTHEHLAGFTARRCGEIDERDFTKLFLSTRPWVWNGAARDSAHQNGRIQPVFMVVEPRKYECLYVESVRDDVRALVDAQLCDRDRDGISFDAVPWDDGYAIWMKNHLVIAQRLLAVVDPATVPLLERAP